MIDDTITLEPRLQEYLKKKKYCEKNNIEVQVPLEMTYCITQDDTKELKDLIGVNKIKSGNKRLNNDKFY